MAQMEIARLKLDEEILAKDMKYHRLETVVAKYTTTFRRNEHVWRYLYKAIDRMFSKTGLAKESRASKLPMNNSVANHSSGVSGQNHPRGGNNAAMMAGGSSASVNTGYQHTARSTSTATSSTIAGSAISTRNHSHNLPSQSDHQHQHNNNTTTSPSYHDHDSGGLWMNARRHMHLPGGFGHPPVLRTHTLPSNTLLHHSRTSSYPLLPPNLTQPSHLLPSLIRLPSPRHGDGGASVGYGGWQRPSRPGNAR